LNGPFVFSGLPSCARLSSYPSLFILSRCTPHLSFISKAGSVLANAHDEDNIIVIIREADMNDKKALTRERILNSASTALIARGPVEPSVSEIMGAAGLTVGGFYAHFDSKEALMLEAFSQLLAERREMVASIDDRLPGEERRALLAAFYLSRRHRDAQEHACPLPTAIGEMARLSDDFRDALSEHVELMVAQLAAGPEEADKTLADIALMVGGLALARALGPSELSDRVLRAAKSAVL
jgi:TetR/AcrR family transcriptional repressor of nem operon